MRAFPAVIAFLVAAVLACGASCPAGASFDLPAVPRPIDLDRLQARWLVAQGPVNPDRQGGPRLNVDDQGGARFNPADPAQQVGPRDCLFLLDSCKGVSVPANQPLAPKDATSAPACVQPVGSHVIVNVPWKDADNGLLLRASPSMQAPVLSIVPAHGVGLIVSGCSDGWCGIEYNCRKGFAGAKYVAERTSRLRNVSNVSPADPDGLNVRNGPGASYDKVSSIPYNGKQVVVHNCQTVSNTSWCLVTYQNRSGWVAGRFLSL
jgi:uncharacterized protein YraI